MSQVKGYETSVPYYTSELVNVVISQQEYPTITINSFESILSNAKYVLNELGHNVGNIQWDFINNTNYKFVLSWTTWLLYYYCTINNNIHSMTMTDDHT